MNCERCAGSVRVAPHGRGNLKLILAAKPFDHLYEGFKLPLSTIILATEINFGAEFRFIFYLHLLSVTEMAMQCMGDLLNGSHFVQQVAQEHMEI